MLAKSSSLGLELFLGGANVESSFGRKASLRAASRSWAELDPRRVAELCMVVIE